MTKNIFEQIKKINARNKEFWSARELFKLLGYTEYNKFLPTIERAKIACESSEQAVNLHFAQVSETQPSHNQHGLIQGQEIEEILGIITLPLRESRGMKSSGSLTFMTR